MEYHGNFFEAVIERYKKTKPTALVV